MKYKKVRKLISFIASFSLVLQTFLPLTLAMPAYAEGDTATDSSTPVIASDSAAISDPVVTPEPLSAQTAELSAETPSATPTPTIEVTPEPTPETTIEATVTPEATDSTSLTASPTAQPDATPTVIPEITPTPIPSSWTFENVELNKEYQNGGVTLTFTKLPDPSGNIKIEEITLTEEQIKQTGSLSDKAYDITSDMVNGSFSYNLSLPIPESSKGKAVEVKSAEEISNISSAAKVENTLTKTDTSVSVANLNHFTVFIITIVVLQPDYAAPGAGGVYSAYYGPPDHNPASPGTTTTYDGRGAGIIKAGQGANPGSSNWDEGLFAFKPTVTINDFASGTVTYDVENQVGVNPVWMTIEIDTGTLLDRTDNTTYQFVPTTNPAGWHTVDARAGQWQKWNNGAGDVTGNPLMSLSDITATHTGLNVVRAYLRLGMGDSYYNGGTGTIAWVDQATFGGETYDFSITSVTTKDATGVTSDDATLNGFNKSDATGHSFWVSLNTFSTASPTIPAGVYSTPNLGSIAANADFSAPLTSVTGLPAVTANTKYYFAAWSNVGGTWYPGEILNFTTANGPVFIDTNVNGVLNSGEQSFNTIQAAINAATSGNTIHVTAGTYTEVGQIVIDKNLSIVGDGKTTTIIKPESDTSGTGDVGSWILVNDGITFNLSKVTLDGVGRQIRQGIRFNGSGTVDDVIIQNIVQAGYMGFAIVQGYDNTGSRTLNVTNSTFTNFGRVGIQADNGSGSSTVTISNNNFTGKGNGDHLDYAVTVEGGSVATITNNIISNCRGVASTDGSTSAGISATTYFADGTTATITGNTITNSTYGIAVGYGDDDSTSVPQLNTNTFSSNAYDLDNHTVNNIDARNNTWSVADRNNLDQIEAKINHNCSNSTYVHGICTSDDYSTGGMVQYKDIGTPSNLGWNVGSKSSTPNETPLDLACPTSTVYTNENNVAQNWTSVSGTNIKYQREVTFPSNAISNIEAGSNTYTPFSTFGSSTGTEGLWKTKVRAYVDANGNNKYDSGEEVSGWSNECKITFDKTAPTTPTHSSPVNNSYLTTANWTLADWSNETGLNGPVTYIYESSFSNTTGSDGSFISPVYVSGTLSDSQIPTLGTPQGIYYWHVRAIDTAGNKSAWTSPWKVTVDNTAPVKPAFTAPTNNLFTHINSVTLTWSDGDDTGTTQSGIKGYTIRYTFVPMGGGATVNWTSNLIVSGNPKMHSGSYGHGQGTYTMYVSTTDNAGNVSPESDSLVVTYDVTAPVITIGSYNTSWTNGNITVTATTNEGTLNTSTHTFTANGSFDFIATDAAGNITTKTVTITNIDNTAPGKPTITSPTTEQYFKTTPILNQWGVITDSSGIKQYTVEYIYDDGHTFSGAPYRYTTTNSRNHSPGITEQGGVTIRVRAEDNAGNIGEWSNSVHYIYDATAPALVSKTTFSGWHSSNQISTFTYSDAFGVVSGTPVTCDITTEGINQTCSVTPNVCDAAGNCNTTLVTSDGADIDKTNPASVITTFGLPNGASVTTSTWNGRVDGTALDDRSGVNLVKLEITRTLFDSGAVTKYWNHAASTWQDAPVVFNAVGNINWNYQLPTPVVEGTYQITSHAVDNAGNEETTYSITIIYDKTIPEVTISLNPAVADASNGWYKTQPEVTLTATDPNIDKIKYQWDSQTGTWTTYSAPFKPANEGGHVLYYRAQDLAGNYSDVGVKNISWDQTELELAPQNVSADPNPTSGSTSKISWSTAKDNVGIDKYEVKWTLNDSTNPSSYSLTVGSDIREKEIDQLTEGRWTVSVRAFDAAGHSLDSSIDLYVDRTGPVAPTLSLTGTGVGTAILSWTTVTDATDYIIWYGNAPGSRLFGARVGNINTYTVRGLGAGNYYFIVKAVDAAQNQGSESNEVSTGTIIGAPGAEEGTPAEGFTPQVQGVATEATPSPTPEATPEILGSTTEENKNNNWWWLLLLIPLYFGGRKIFKKK